MNSSSTTTNMKNVEDGDDDGMLQAHEVPKNLLENLDSATDDKIQHQNDDSNLNIKKVEEDEGGEGEPEKVTTGKDEKTNAAASDAAVAAPGVSDTLMIRKKKIDTKKKKKTAAAADGKKSKRRSEAYRNSTNTTILDPAAAKNENNNNNDDDQKTTISRTSAVATATKKDITNKEEGNKKHPPPPPRGMIELASATGPVKRNTTTVAAATKKDITSKEDNKKHPPLRGDAMIELASATGPVKRNTTTAYLSDIPPPSSSDANIRSSDTTNNRGKILLASANGPVQRNATTAYYLDPKVPQQPLPSLLPPRSSVDDVQKNKISLATGSGDVGALPSTMDSAVNRTSANSGRERAGTNNNDSSNNDVGAFRVGNDDESIGMFSMMTRGTSSANMVKATPIDATLAPSNDIEAIVEERIRKHSEGISVAQQVEVMTPPTTEEGKPRRSCHVMIYFVICLAIIVAAILAAVFVPKGEEEDKGEVAETTVNPPPTTTTMENDTPTLEQIRQRGFLRCGADEFKIGFSYQSPATNDGSFDGFFVDYCRALAMAILGDPEKIEVIFVTSADRFQRLRDNEIDVLTATTTWTMGRDIFETHSSLGMSFSAPFYYDGMVFAGRSRFVDCAEKLDSFTGRCRNLSVCVIKGTTHLSILDKIFPGAEKVLVDGDEEYVSALIDDTCKVVAADSVAVPESFFRALGYTDVYFKVGEKKFSKEPLAIATRDDDFEFSKMANMAIEVLYTAEEIGITQDTVASDMVELEALQDNGLKSFFVDIISTMGNMGELYERHLESTFPRQGLNFLNDGTGGLIYSFPFGDVENRGELSEGGKISSILQRQKLRCGISRRPGFADFDADLSSLWAGIDAEFCFAVSAALFSTLGARAQVEFVELEASDSADRLDLLARGEIDVLAGERVTLERMWRQNPETYSGYLYSPPYYHDNDTADSFALVTSSDDSQWSDFVFWVVMSTFYAEERGIQQSDYRELPIVSLFGESVKQMFLDTIWEVGNYGNIYNRTIESMHPRAGRNTLNLGSTPQMLGFPLS